MTRRKKHIPFVKLSKNKRSDAVIQLKNDMRKNASVYGGMFSSHQMLDEPCRPDLYNQWFDFLMPGKDRFTLWNVEIITARKAFWDKAHDLAYERINDMLSPYERDFDDMSFEPADISSTGKVLTYTMVFKDTRYDQFDGRTFYEQWEKAEADVVRDTPITIYESFRTDPDYAYGIGLYMIIDADVINRESVERAILKFREIGETDWKADEPVSADRLPKMSEREALTELNYEPNY